MTTKLTTRKGNKMSLDGDKLSGDTYPIRDYLKKFCDAHGWNGTAWTVDLDKLNKILSISNSIGLRIDDSAPRVESQHTQRWLNSDGSLSEDY